MTSRRRTRACALHTLMLFLMALCPMVRSAVRTVRHCVTARDHCFFAPPSPPTQVWSVVLLSGASPPCTTGRGCRCCGTAWVRSTTRTGTGACVCVFVCCEGIQARKQLRAHSCLKCLSLLRRSRSRGQGLERALVGWVGDLGSVWQEGARCRMLLSWR